jgi:hypothetical protein
VIPKYVHRILGVCEVLGRSSLRILAKPVGVGLGLCLRT